MITTERNQYIAAHTTKPVKKALEHEAAKDDPVRPSVSKIIHEILEKEMKARGYNVEEK